MAKKEKKPQKISKMTVDEMDLKSDTIPNPIVTGGMEAIGLTRINPIEIPQYLLMHPALPRGIEMKANRMIKLVDEDLETNMIQNNSLSDEKKVKRLQEKNKNISKERIEELKGLVEGSREYCRDILYNSGGALYLKQLATGAFRFGTSFSVLQTNIAESEVLKFEYQHEIFFGPARYPKPLKGVGVDWGEIPMVDRLALAGKMKINTKTKKIAKYTQLTRRYPERIEDNYKVQSAEYVNTRTHPHLKTKSPGELVPTGKEIDEEMVIQLVFDKIGDEPLGISLVQFLHLTVKYLLNMEKAGAQTMVNFGFNKWIANTPFKDDKKMRAFGTSLARINVDAVVVLPKDIELTNIMPGTTEFYRVHPIYLQLIAIRLGIPVPLLLQSGTDTNKATIQEMRKDMYEDFIADELTIEQCVNEGFFKACRIKYPELSVKELDLIVPKFKFNQPPEDMDVEQKRTLDFSLMVRNYSMAAQMWREDKFSKGDPAVVKVLSKKVIILIEKSIEQSKKEFQEKKDEKKK